MCPTACAAAERSGAHVRARHVPLRSQILNSLSRTSVMTLILNHLPPIHWAAAGAGIAAITLLLLFVGNRRLGLLERLRRRLRARPRPAVFPRGEPAGGARLAVCRSSPAWSSAALLSALPGGGWHPTWELGMFDRVIGLGRGRKDSRGCSPAGCLIGFGTRLAGGCTSGHGIFGLSNLELPSLMATISFMAGGIAHDAAPVPRVSSDWQRDALLYVVLGTVVRLRPEPIRRRRLRLHSGDVPVRVVPAVRDHRHGVGAHRAGPVAVKRYGRTALGRPRRDRAEAAAPRHRRRRPAVRRRMVDGRNVSGPDLRERR